MRRPFKLVISLITAFSMVLSSSTPSSAAKKRSDIFYDSFSGSELNTEKWLVAYKNWGGKVTENGVTVDYNGGVVPQNVSVRGGKLILEGHGNKYKGDVLGVNKDMSRREDGKRVGAAIATKEYFASGSYEIRAKISPKLGACSAMWTFEYE